jgi:uncharacterized protein with FMN-binding domain
MSKGKKIVIGIVAAFIIIIAAGFIAFFNTENKMSAYAKNDFGSLDMSKVDDGKYIGSEDAGVVKVKVEVTVKDHAITDIAILQHDNGKGAPAEVIVNDIIDKNSLEVDAISGATHSSNVIKTAVLNALTE